MGVTGLWRLIEPSGNLVPLQTLDNKVLAVDVSIWLHQAIKGFQNAQGGTLPNAHLLGIYHRICKLLFFGIKPVVIFDGGVPHLKQQTIFQRANRRSKTLSDAETIHSKLVSALLKHTAISKILSDESKASLTVKPVKEQAEDIYKLPPANLDSTQSSDEDESSTSVEASPTKHWDLHTIDEKSEQFKALPADVRHDILTDLKETRKQSSWGRLHELPKQSDDFSIFQMKRLLKRYSVQVSLEEAEKEMGGRSLSLAELESLLKDQGVVTNDDSVGKRIASDESKKYLLIKDLKKAMDEAKKQEIIDIINEEEIDLSDSEVNESTETKKSDSEFENDLKLAIALSLQDVPTTSKATNPVVPKKLHEMSFLQDFDEEDFHVSSESDEDISKKSNENKVLKSAQNYMLEYSGLTPNEISKIISGGTKPQGQSSAEASQQKSEIRTEAPLVYKALDNKTQLSSNTENLDLSRNYVSEAIDEVTPDAVETTKAVDVDREEDEDSDSSGDFVASHQKSEIRTEAPPVDEALETKTQLIRSNTENLDVSRNYVLEAIDEVTPDAVETTEAVDVDREEDEESDSSGDFVEVHDENNKKLADALEIVVKPEDALEDDLFSDVFKKEISQPSKPMVNKPNLRKITETINAEEAIVTAEEINKRTEELPQDSDRHDAKQKERPATPISREKLQEIQQDLQLENVELVKEQLSKERMANSLSEQIIQETQDLLRLFGIPYVVAPMEAEAQCAFLEIIDLTDGTITDDSDIWLFGGKTVYKNFFNQQKHVLEFRAEKIQEHYKLSREQMILLALLVGSDYTLGLQGVGPVTALEILGAFPSSLKQIENTYNYQQLVSGLIDFRKWLNGERTIGMGRQGLRSKLKNVSISDAFPNLDVLRAYLEPNVDISKKPFSWGKPNVDGLIDYAKRKFGWSGEKSKSILKPVFKRIEPEVQKSIKHYFKSKYKISNDSVENKMSKRVKKAVENMDNKADQEDETKKKKRGKKVKVTDAPKSTKKQSNDQLDTACGLSSDEDVKVLKITKDQSETKLNQIQKEVVSQIVGMKKPPSIATLHRKEVIPQRQRDKSDALKRKIKAIETFRKSKKGPGFVQPRKRQARAPKADAELSESSSD